ncbi:MAG: ParB/RepB/Spo0J family partition protein, partial [Planctomycetota bacterium]
MNRVERDPSQPRIDFDSSSIDSLAASIRDHGQLQPIRVRWSEETQKWRIISGERRWRATIKAGLPSITCFFDNGQADAGNTLHEQLIENLQREDLRPTEEAQAFAALMDLHGWNGKQLAEALHVSTSKVSRSLGLLDL